MDCSWVSLSDGKEKFYFVAEKAPFELGVKPYSDPELLHMKHREDEKNTGTYVTIQAFQQGIGTGSCGPGIARAYRYPMRKKYVLSFAIVKTKADDLL